MTRSPSSQDLLPADLAMGTVLLKVGDMKTMSAYYQQALGLDIVAEADGGLYLGRGRTPLVQLVPAPGLRTAGGGEAGLFHTALLFQDQASLAATVASAAQFEPQAFVGSADHLVSEAFYFTDPEGNGIELYHDRPRTHWQWEDGHVAMDSLALSPQQYLNEHLTEAVLAGQRQQHAAVGHVHLQVGEVRLAREFYVETLGFEQTALLGDQALFVSAGGYHHHLAMNVWNSRGAGPRKDTLGLGEVLIRLPGADDVGALAQRLAHRGVAVANTGAELVFPDPWNNRIRVIVDTEPAA
ncbi:VOC family protein [Arthrobacter sp. H14-L1]|uniref:VOC family protein n=1 Tax=Arthrobacter sp. H14-L1 TaxID=2996697 RepID=UPI00226F2CD4|nr:VOC family protein [Arthrobacter sp. H14-L1]MCY0905504.1 VOC family protein [Arthrobacter sp. H14-L1]